MRISLRSFALVLAATAVACTDRGPLPRDSSRLDSAKTRPAALPAGEGKLAVDGGSIWYKVSGSGSGTPAILLHGGPGLSSYYLKPLEALADEQPVVRYDQLGSGKSGTLTDTTKMTIPHFVAELEALRAHLGYDKVHLVGHSWGTIMAVEYYRAHPEHVASLTLSGDFLDIPQWERHTRALLATLPDSVQRVVKKAEVDKAFDSPGYQAAIGGFYQRYVFLRPVKADADSGQSQMNDRIYNYMQGPSEFTITGTLRHYDASGYLKDVKVPTLFTVGEFDEADPVTTKKHAAMTPGAKVVVIPNAAHVTTWDNPQATIDAIRAHLRNADSLATRK